MGVLLETRIIVDYIEKSVEITLYNLVFDKLKDGFTFSQVYDLMVKENKIYAEHKDIMLKYLRRWLDNGLIRDGWYKFVTRW